MFRYAAMALVMIGILAAQGNALARHQGLHAGQLISRHAGSDIATVGGDEGSGCLLCATLSAPASSESFHPTTVFRQPVHLLSDVLSLWAPEAVVVPNSLARAPPSIG
jgi:hypothetical protein